MLLIFIKYDHEQCVRIEDDSLDLMGEKHMAVPFLPSKIFHSPISQWNFSAEKKRWK